MKQIRFLLTLVLFGSCICPLIAQHETKVKGKYNGQWVYMEYNPDSKQDEILRIEYNKKELTKLINGLKDERDKAINQRDNAIKELEKKTNQNQNKSADQSQDFKSDSTVIRLRRDKLDLEDQRDSLQGEILLLNDSIRLLNDSLDKVNVFLAVLSKEQKSTGTFSGLADGEGPHVGAYYRIGIPWLINKGLDSDLWSRKVSLSHQVGIYWNSASFSDKLPMTYGAGLEYNWLKFSAGVGHFEVTPFRDQDRDGDTCTTFLTYNNVTENASLQYLSIPLSFSIGAPRNNRVSGYFQVSFVTSILIKNTLTANGKYSLSGQYEIINGNDVDVHLYNIPQLGYYTDQSIAGYKNEASLCPIVVTGRLSGGVYIPLCNTAMGQTSQWSVKVGVSLDMATRINKKEGNGFSKNTYQTIANYRLKQNDFLDSKNTCWFINPSLEIGILYIFNK